MARLVASLLMLSLFLPACSGAAARADVAEPLANYPVGSYVMGDGSIAVPLRGEPAAWMTEDVKAKAKAASLRGLGYDPETDQEASLSPDVVHLGPGALMLAPSTCTMSFVFGSPGSYSIGSAGHCNPLVGEDVFIATATSLVLYIGSTGMSHNNGVGDDYSRTSIIPSLQAYVDPTVAVIGGPQGVYRGSGGSPTLVKLYGHGTLVGSPRVGYLQSAAVAFSIDGVAGTGDAGTPVLVAASSALGELDQGIGILTHLLVGGSALSVAAGTRLTAIAAQVANGDLGVPPPTPLTPIPPRPLPSRWCVEIIPHAVATPDGASVLSGYGSVCKGVQPAPMPTLHEELAVDVGGRSPGGYVDGTGYDWDYGFGTCPGWADEPVPCPEVEGWIHCDPDDPVRCPVSPATAVEGTVVNACAQVWWSTASSDPLLDACLLPVLS